MTPNTLERVETRYSIMPTAGRMAYARTLADAAQLIPEGLYDSTTGRPSPAKIFLVLETGAMLGLDPMASLQGIDVIEGRATIAPRLMLAFIRAAGHEVKISKFGTRKGGDLGATVWTKRADSGEIIENTFTVEDAEAAELLQLVQDPRTGGVKITARAKSGKIKPWEAYTQSMCVWRAVGMCAREGYEDLLMGIAWTPEELAAIVDEDGQRARPVAEDEAELIARISAITDRADMRRLYHEVRQSDELTWTTRVSAAFDGHLATLKYDSDEAVQGRPGHTGIPELDGDGAHEDAPADDEASGAAESAAYDRHVGEQIGDDPTWQGGPCTVCGLNHAASAHDLAAAPDVLVRDERLTTAAAEPKGTDA